MTTSTPTTPTSLAEEVLARLESAWNDADGSAFGFPYAPDATFVTIRGQHLTGRENIAAGHAGIFATSYAGSRISMQLLEAAEVVEGVVLAVSANTLDCPTGPLCGVHRALSTSVIARRPSVDPDGFTGPGWQIVATHNTLEA